MKQTSFRCRPLFPEAPLKYSPESGNMVVEASAPVARRPSGGGGYLPADADASGVSNANDIVQVVDYLNGVLTGGEPPEYSSGIDRRGPVTRPIGQRLPTAPT